MSKIISIFNNKGGVGKTTFVYHLAYALEAMGKKVLLVDGDPQCSLSIHFLTDSRSYLKNKLKQCCLI